jgi:hypothetical protein
MSRTNVVDAVEAASTLILNASMNLVDIYKRRENTRRLLCMASAAGNLELKQSMTQTRNGLRDEFLAESLNLQRAKAHVPYLDLFRILNETAHSMQNDSNAYVSLNDIQLYMDALHSVGTFADHLLAFEVLLCFLCLFMFVC